MLPQTTACLASKGKTIVGKDKESQRFINRMNSVDKLFCDFVRRVNIQTALLSNYCNIIDQNDGGSYSSSSSNCPVGPCVPAIPEYRYLINVTDLDDDAYGILEDLESEACATLRKLRKFEIININFNGSSSSSIPDGGGGSGSESESSSQSSSNSGSGSDSSSEFSYDISSSSSEEPSCPTSLHLASYCEALPGLSSELFPRPPTGIGNGSCEYQGIVYDDSSSSSSSLSSSSSGISQISLKFITATNKWQISADPYGIIAEKLGDEFDPTGVYVFLYGPCTGQSIFVV